MCFLIVMRMFPVNERVCHGQNIVILRSGHLSRNLKSLANPPDAKALLHSTLFLNFTMGKVALLLENQEEGRQ